VEVVGDVAASDPDPDLLGPEVVELHDLRRSR
jgi:hypothetical protein